MMSPWLGGSRRVGNTADNGEFYTFRERGYLGKDSKSVCDGSIRCGCMTNKPRVLLADDHAAFAREVESLLEPEFEVVGTVHDGRAATEAARLLSPDVVVLDVKMPVMGGIESARSIFEHATDARVVFLSSYRSPALVRDALATGALGYVFKASAVEDLVRAIRAAIEGQTFVSSGE